MAVAGESSGDGKARRVVGLRLQVRPAGAATVESTEANVGGESARLLGPGVRFVGRMVALLQYQSGVGRIAETTDHVNLAALSVLLAEIRAADLGTSAVLATADITWQTEDGEGRPGSSTQAIQITRGEHLSAVREFMASQNVAHEVLHESLLQQIINEFELLEQGVVRNYYQGVGRKQLGSSSLTYSKILSAKSIEELHDQVVEEAVADHMRKSLKDRLSTYGDALKCDVRSECKLVPIAREAMLRRHAVVHCGRIAVRQYIDGLKGVELPSDFHRPEVGQRLELSGGYVFDAWKAFFCTGVVLMHQWAVQQSRHQSSVEAEARADDWLSDAVYAALERSVWPAAIVIGEYALGRTLKSHGASLRIRVNVSQAQKWSGNNNECERLLGGHDWATQAAEFQLCVAALREDRVTFESALRLAAQSGKIAPHLLLEWPVFRGVRKLDWFDAAVEAAFGQRASGSVVRVRSMLMDDNPDRRLKEIQRWLAKIGRRVVRAKSKRQSQATPEDPAESNGAQ